MFVEVDSATALVSFGTLVTLWVVCNAQMYRRYSPEVQMRFTRCLRVLLPRTQWMARANAWATWLQVWHRGDGSQD